MSMVEYHRHNNGAIETIVNGIIIFIHYNNGDEVYFNEAGRVWRIKTYDGLDVTYHRPAYFNLTARVSR